MATASEVKSGLGDISTIIRTERNALKQIAARATASVANLSALQTNYADLKAQIDSYTPTGPFESLAKDEMDKLIAERLALKAKATTARDGLAAIDFAT